MKPTEKFTKKAEYYNKARPQYSEEFINFIRSRNHISNTTKIADVGSGTGILTKQLLALNCEIIGIEPNDEMRKYAERNLKEFSNFKSINATAENTSIESNSVDIIIAAQAFHWFDTKLFKMECNRILKKNGTIYLVWNHKDEEQPYLVEVEEANRKYCPDFNGFSGSRNTSENKLFLFFQKNYRTEIFENNLYLNKDEFINAIFSASYSPNKIDPNYSRYLSEIKKIFFRYSKNKKLMILNNTVVYYI